MACFYPWQSKTLLGKSGSDQHSCLNRPDKPSEPPKEPLSQSLIFLNRLGWGVAFTRQAAYSWQPVRPEFGCRPAAFS
jgi:hypothetical protein